MTLKIDRHETFRRREHALTRVGWVVMGALVLAGLFGLVGPGPWSASTARSPSGAVEVEHLRVAHIEADDSITLTFAPDTVEDGAVVVDLTGPWVAGVDRQGITPTPSEETLIPGGVRLEFAADPSPSVAPPGDDGAPATAGGDAAGGDAAGGDAAAAPPADPTLEVSVSFRAKDLWSLPGRASVAGESAEFSQFVLP